MNTTHNNGNSHLLTKKNQSGAQERESCLENFYNYLGHEAFTKLIVAFEKFCTYGKSVPTMQMDFTQFMNFINKNNLGNDKIKKNQLEISFNTVRNNKKSINFHDFLYLLIEIGKLEIPFEKNKTKILNYFFNKNLIGCPSMQKNDIEKNLERWYFYLESSEIRKEVSKNLSMLHKFFLKYKVKDLKLGEVMDTNEMIRFCKDLSIIPTFLSSKDVAQVIIFILYLLHSLLYIKKI